MTTDNDFDLIFWSKFASPLNGELVRVVNISKKMYRVITPTGRSFDAFADELYIR